MKLLGLPAWYWLVMAAGGVGIGLYLRRRAPGQAADGSTFPLAAAVYGAGDVGSSSPALIAAGPLPPNGAPVKVGEWTRHRLPVEPRLPALWSSANGGPR